MITVCPFKPDSAEYGFFFQDQGVIFKLKLPIAENVCQFTEA